MTRNLLKEIFSKESSMERTLGGLTCLIVLFSLSGDCLGVDEDRRRAKDLFAELDKTTIATLCALSTARLVITGSLP